MVNFITPNKLSILKILYYFSYLMRNATKYIVVSIYV